MNLVLQTIFFKVQALSTKIGDVKLDSVAEKKEREPNTKDSIWEGECKETGMKDGKSDRHEMQEQIDRIPLNTDPDSGL